MVLLTEHGERMKPADPPPPSTAPREEEESPAFIQHACLGLFAVLIAPVCVVVAPFALLGWVIKRATKPKGESE
jgi:hypothetical protein